MHPDDSRGVSRIDLDRCQPRAWPGGTVVFAPIVVETPSGEQRAGERPVAICGLYSPTDLRNALSLAGYSEEAIERAFKHRLTGETAIEAVSIAERAELLA